MAGRHASSHQASSIEAPIPVSSVDCVVIGAGWSRPPGVEGRGHADHERS